MKTTTEKKYMADLTFVGDNKAKFGLANLGDVNLEFTIITKDGTAKNKAIEVCNKLNSYKELLNALKQMVNEYGIFANVPENYKELEGWPGDENPRTTAMVIAMEAIKNAGI